MQPMKKNPERLSGIWAPLACSLALLTTGCTYAISERLDEQGNAAKLVFPEITQSEALERGIFPNLDNLRMVKSGVTKDDLYYLIDEMVLPCGQHRQGNQAQPNRPNHAPALGQTVPVKLPHNQYQHDM